jgi:WhiB family redox-sensing transcriptional regulator
MAIKHDPDDTDTMTRAQYLALVPDHPVPWPAPAERLVAAIAAGRPDWFDRAACRDMGPDVFFTGKGVPTAPAKAICAGCPVTAECLAYGLREKWGVWGGEAERSRRRIRVQANRAKRAAEIRAEAS